MPTEIITTDGTINPVTLSVNEVYGQRITTIIEIDGTKLPSIQSNFNDHQIGTNASLTGTTISVTTTSLKVTPTNNTEVDFTVKGAGPDVTDLNLQHFAPGELTVTHLMSYIML
jgi:hypothetical protein